jgi:hypothetical protein
MLKLNELLQEYICTMFVRLYQEVLIMLTPQALDCPVVHPINSKNRLMPVCTKLALTICQL